MGERGGGTLHVYVVARVFNAINEKFYDILHTNNTK